MPLRFTSGKKYPGVMAVTDVSEGRNPGVFPLGMARFAALDSRKQTRAVSALTGVGKGHCARAFLALMAR